MSRAVVPVSATIVMLGGEEWRCQEGYYGGKKRVWVELTSGP